ncbi:MAG: hypothetical protein KF745_04110 [Phycisphaeraceae bacterium]|nr:hypothetical protein [Phycisphaeraceae bacterium]
MPGWVPRPPEVFGDGSVPKEGIAILVTAYGWPRRSGLHTEAFGELADGDYRIERRHRWEPRIWPNHTVTLPSAPIWPGIIADTLFWFTAVALVAAVLFGPGRLRRSWRRRRSRCAHCGYPLQGLVSDACPQCGTSCNATDKSTPPARES